MTLATSYHSNSHAEEFIDRTHPLRVTLCEILIHSHHMHAFGRQRIEVHRQGRHKGLAFTGTHFSNLALMQGHATDELYIEMAQPEGASGRFAHHRKCFRQQLIECYTGHNPLTEFAGLVPQLSVTQALE